MAEDLISRSVLFRRLDKRKHQIGEDFIQEGICAGLKHYLVGEYSAIKKAMTIVEEMPEVDPDQVEVIRCKDCYYWSKKESHKMKDFRMCSRMDEYTAGDGYCSFAYEKE